MKRIAFLIKWLIGLVLFALGLVLLALGAIGAVFGVGVFQANDGRANQVLGQVWFQNDPFFWVFDSHSIQLVQVVIERKLGLIWLWNPAITTLLNWPSWIALFTLAGVGLTLGFVLIRVASRLPNAR